MSSQLTPIGSAAEKLAESGVPLASIVSMIEGHYAAALKESEAQLRDALVGNLQLETLQAALRKQEARNEDLAARVAVAVDRTSALQNFRTNASPARTMLAEASIPPSDESLLAMADEQSSVRRASMGRTVGPGARPTVTPQQGGSGGGGLASRLNHDQLQRQLDAAKADLQVKTVALERERSQRRRLEAENHSLNMHALGIHDEMSRLNGIVDATRTRLRDQTSVFDRDRQDLMSQTAELRRELQSTRQRAETESEALSTHVNFLTDQLAELQRSHADLKEDYHAVAKRGDSFEGRPDAHTTPKRTSTPTTGAPAFQSQGQSAGALEAIRALQLSLDEMTTRATAAEDQAERLRRQLDAQVDASLSAHRLQSLKCSPTPPRVAIPDRPLAIEDRAGTMSTTPPPRVGADTTVPLSKTPVPSWASATAQLRKAAAKAPPPPRKKAEHDGFRPDADPHSLMRLRGPATVVTIDGARAFAGRSLSLSPTRLNLRPKPHRGRPLAPIADGSAAKPQQDDGAAADGSL